MVQGDDTLLIPAAIADVAAPLLADPGVDIVNLLSPLESEEDYSNPNIEFPCNKNMVVSNNMDVPKTPCSNNMDVSNSLYNFLKH